MLRRVWLCFALGVGATNCSQSPALPEDASFAPPWPELPDSGCPAEAVEEVACEAGGSRTRRCVDGRWTWQGFCAEVTSNTLTSGGAPVEEGMRCPARGITEERPCGVAGVEMRTCDGEAWSAWSTCSEPDSTTFSIVLVEVTVAERTPSGAVWDRGRLGTFLGRPDVQVAMGVIDRGCPVDVFSRKVDDTLHAQWDVALLENASRASLDTLWVEAFDYDSDGGHELIARCEPSELAWPTGDQPICEKDGSRVVLTLVPDGEIARPSVPVNEPCESRARR